MSLRDELMGGTTACKLCAFLDELSDSGEWVELLALPVAEVGNMQVVKALRRRGLIIDERSVRRHRRNHV